MIFHDGRKPLVDNCAEVPARKLLSRSPVLLRRYGGVGLLAGAILLSACPPSPVTPPPDADAAPSASCATACAALAAAGCSLGKQSDCPAFLTRDLGSGKVPNAATGRPLTCGDVASVKTVPDAQLLGFACN